MISPTDLAELNQKLIDHYGRFDSNRANYRVVYSEDQLEKRWTNYSRDGFQLLHPMVIEVPKYRQWIHHKYVLERITVVPNFVISDLTTNISYEPVWVFEDVQGNPLVPIFRACDLIIKQILENVNKYVHGAKYKEDEKELNTPEAKRERVEELKKVLFGNETDIGDALAYDSGVGYGVRDRSDSKLAN